jgi:acetyltransferase-like isoleucine patch superfamily enzyme
MLIKLFDKTIRELYRLFHPHLWGRNLQINGIPRIYDIKKLKIGQNVSVNTDCVLQCYGGLIIGNNVTISDGAKILTRSLRTTNYIENASKREREHIEKEIEIGDGVWVAANAVILPGVHIAKNSIIAAGSIVTTDLTDESCLYGGIPAKKIKELKNK